MHPGEIYLARFPFGDVPGMKLRPVLLLTRSVGSIPEVLVAYISSVVPSKTLPSDLILDPLKAEFHSTRLKVVSALRLHKLATLHCSSLARRLGALDRTQHSIVAAKLRTLLEL
jgi:mRNA-degrading endonuclease toxin of MazEF toxin-antitoxin module